MFALSSFWINEGERCVFEKNVGDIALLRQTLRIWNEEVEQFTNKIIPFCYRFEAK